MKISIKGIILSYLATMFVGILLIVPLYVLFPTAFRSRQFPILLSLLLLLIGASLSMLSGFLLYRISGQESFAISAFITAGVLSLTSLKEGIVFAFVGFVVSVMLMYVGRMFAKR